MQGQRRINFGRLLGLETVSDQISGTLDLRDEALGAKLGAKVGTPETTPPRCFTRDQGKPDFARLLGFETLGGCLANGVDFRDEALGAKLGAKVGDPEAGPMKMS